MKEKLGEIKENDKIKTIEPKTSDEIIRQHAVFGMAAGAIPIPVVDVAAVTAIQIDMIRQLANFFEVDFNEEQCSCCFCHAYNTDTGN